ncbi:8524_t:CDS:2 [Ambispora gerdemannii]|uniref:8524_t:CDS:1 n=1 Tax=Ambispora gerdemannii TaxID=144530 RepID=A0A9N8VJB0_9GLOM|nr:8524_t:CDS:2 [Ambispora gerdemannii]
MAVSVANYQSDPTQGKLATLVYDDENVSLVNFLPPRRLSIYENTVAQQTKTTTTTEASTGKQTAMQRDRASNGGNHISLASRHSMYNSSDIQPRNNNNKIRRRASSYNDHNDKNHIRPNNNRHQSMPTRRFPEIQKPQIYEEIYIGPQKIEAISQKTEIITRAAAPQQQLVETEVVGIDGEKNRIKDQQQQTQQSLSKQRTQSLNEQRLSSNPNRSIRGSPVDLRKSMFKDKDQMSITNRIRRNGSNSTSKADRRRSDGVIYDNKKNRNSSSNSNRSSYNNNRNDIDSDRSQLSSISPANGDSGSNFKHNNGVRRRFNTAPASSNRRRSFIDISSLFKNDKKPEKESSEQDKNTQQKNTSSSSSSEQQRRKKRHDERKKKRISDDLKDVSFSNAETVTKDDFDEIGIKNQEIGGVAGVGSVIPPRSSSMPFVYHYSPEPQQLHQLQQIQQSNKQQFFNSPEFPSDNINNEAYSDVHEDHEDNIQSYRPFSLPPPSKHKTALKRYSTPTSIIKNTSSKNNNTFTNSPETYDSQPQNNPYSKHLSQASHSVPSLGAVRDTEVTPSPSTPSLKRLQFSSTIFIHDTWTKEDYDRSGDQTTCNKLTPMLAQRIKQELNEYKLSEMPVHEASKQNTHFFA